MPFKKIKGEEEKKEVRCPNVPIYNNSYSDRKMQIFSGFFYIFFKHTVF